MFDRMLSSALWFVVMLLITASAGCALFLSYKGVFALCAAHYDLGGLTVGSGILMALVSYMLCHHANDLMDR